MILRHLLCVLAALTAACSATGEKTPDDNGAQSQTDTTEEQTTPPAPTFKAFSFIQISDTQLGFQTGDPSEFTEDTLALDFMIKQINRLKPAFVLNTGDMTDNSTNQTQIGAYKKVIARLDPSIPLHHLPGNHDVGSACSKAKVAAFEQNYGPSKFCFKYENCTIIGLNTCAVFAANPSSGDPSEEAAEIAAEQFTWLTQMLMDASGSAAKIVFGHYPVFVKAYGEDRSTNNFLPSERERYWKLFKRYGVAAYGCGHTHYPYNSTYLAIDAVTCGALAGPLGQGFRGAELWKVSETGKVTHEYIAYKDFEKIESL